METIDQIKNETISVTDWIITFLITAIPLVNIIMLFVWSFGGNTPLTKRNWAKATLIIMAIAILISIVFGSLILSQFSDSFTDEMMYSPEY